MYSMVSIKLCITKIHDKVIYLFMRSINLEENATITSQQFPNILITSW